MNGGTSVFAGIDTESKAEAHAVVTAALRRQIAGFAPQDLEALANGLLPIWQTPIRTIQPSGGLPAHIASFRYVIRDEDLNLLDSLITGFSSSVGIGAVILASGTVDGGMVATAGVAIVTSLLKLLYNAAKKGVRLDSTSYAVLATLVSRKGGLTISQLAEILTTSGHQTTPASILDTLNNLKDMPCPNGRVSFVWEQNGVWRSNGV